MNTPQMRARLSFKRRPTATPSLTNTRQDAGGHLPPWSLILLGPYHAALRSKLAMQLARSDEPLWNEVAERWFLGGWPASPDDLPPSARAVLDITAELPRTHTDRAYSCVRVWDTHAPSVADLDRAVAWARQQHAKGGVYVHCAHGHGRSAAVLAACLLDAGAATDVDGAVRILQRARPRARLNTRQRRAVDEWWAAKKGKEE